LSEEVLKGIKVIDFSTMLAAPMAATFLGEFGADVLHIEWKKGDPSRLTGPRKDDIPLMNKILGRNKRHITLDFHHEEAVGLLYELVKDADIVISNFRPQTLQRFKLDYEHLIQYNPNLVMMSFTAYGRTGPYAQRPGYARVAEAFAGLTYITGYPDTPPTFTGTWIADGIGGIAGAYSLMLALFHKQRTGEGQLIDLALYDPVLRIMEDFVVDYGTHGSIKQRHGNINPNAAPNNMYLTGDGKWLAILGNVNMWPRLCQAMGRTDLLDDPKFIDNDVRMANREELDGIISAWTGSMPLKAAAAILFDHEVAHGPVNSVADMFNDPHMWARESLVNVFDPELGEDITVQNVMPRLSKTPGKIKWNGGAIGADNDQVFLNELNLSPARYQELQEKGAI